jgi:hypothetical protein
MARASRLLLQAPLQVLLLLRLLQLGLLLLGCQRCCC